MVCFGIPEFWLGVLVVINGVLSSVGAVVLLVFFADVFGPQPDF